MDRISELPDEILCYILTMLSIKDLLKTSILSRRWCELWTLWRDLHFDIFHVLGKTKEEVLHLPSNSPMEIQVHRDINMDEFVKRVDQFLNNFQGTKINSFFASFYSYDKHSNIIDQWISFAIARGVETINLFLLPIMPCTYVTPYEPYKFVFDLFSETNASTLKHLRLEQCLVCHPTKCDYIPFKNLRSLSLYLSKVDEMFIESLLSNCRWLEELHLFGCEFRSSMSSIVSPSLCYLKVGACFAISDNMPKNINLSLLDCLKLTSLEYHSLLYDGYSLDTLNINTPLLKSFHCTVFYADDPNQYAIFETLSKLEIMRLDINLKALISLKEIQPFKHLKQLNINIFQHFVTVEPSEINLLGILILLRASPLLHKLSVMVSEHG
ncbi:F-box/LRR-repeat protein At3g03360-like [Trifolium pratense]|uniref:F-box/LRR-repeat protein At3g03360-like n=1 Tax=Trifolium pratense TaxID=57577 RepID=UPI001E691934|nr:F-box/LRR-repeat protein At3g03360-like [Trifolium pratense]